MSDEPQRPTSTDDRNAWGAYWTAQGMPWLPGTNASKAAKGTALFFGAIALVLFLPITLLEVGWSTARGGHLPWPALQGVITTPLGALVLTALCILVIGWPYVLASVWVLRRDVARAIDITGVPLMAWPSPWPTRPQPPSLLRWLGYGRREQALNLIMLVLGTLLAIELVGIFSASTLYGFYERGRLPCRTTGTGCSPDSRAWPGRAGCAVSRRPVASGSGIVRGSR